MPINQSEGYDIEEELHPSTYYQTPTTLTAKDYVAIIETVKANGDFVEMADELLSLFRNLEKGQKKAYDIMNGWDISNTKWSFRMWLAWRVLHIAVQYFSRLWRTDKSLIEYFENYKLYLKFEERCLQHPYAYLRGIGAMVEKEEDEKV